MIDRRGFLASLLGLPLLGLAVKPTMRLLSTPQSPSWFYREWNKPKSRTCIVTAYDPITKTATVAPAPASRTNCFCQITIVGGACVVTE